jgi:hypothetical protein
VKHRMQNLPPALEIFPLTLVFRLEQLKDSWITNL